MLSRPSILGIALLAALFVLSHPSFAQSGGVEIDLEQFGVSGAYRPAEVAGMRLKLTLPTDSPTEDSINAWVQWEVTNADGDIAEYGRQIALSRGRSARVWLYAPIDAQADNSTVWPIRVFEYEDGRIGRELGGQRVSPGLANSQRVESEVGLFAVVGNGQLGLERYQRRIINGTLIHPAHEPTHTVYGVRTENLPDRWEGLRSFEALFWTDELPEDLSTAQAEAVREWVRRGGHLIIILPDNTNPWALGEPMRATEFNDMLPTATPRRDDEVALSTLLPILSKSRELGDRQPDRTSTIRVFKDLNGEFDVIDNGYVSLISLDDGRVVVVQRIFGHGRVTLVGLDFTNLNVRNVYLSVHQTNGMTGGSLPEGDVFWNRILGRRSDTLSDVELSDALAQNRLVTTYRTPTLIGQGDLFRRLINRPGRASAGLSLAVLLFIAYWIVAGPGGFFLLKHYRRQRHAWLIFAASAAVFTGMAWGGVTLLRLGAGQGDVQHVTFLDHIARPNAPDDPSDPQMQRAYSWLSMYLPGYGDTDIGIDSFPAQASVPAQRDLLYSWIPPEGVTQTFPNVDRYRVDIETNPDDYAVPTRSTESQFYVSWVGGVDPEWGGMITEDPADPIRVVPSPTGMEEIKGTLINNLPGELRDVKIIWIRSLRIERLRYAQDPSITTEAEAPWIPIGASGDMMNLGKMQSEASFAQDGRLKLAMDSPGFALESNITKLFVDPYRDRPILPSGIGTGDEKKYMEMLSLFQQIDPPAYLMSPSTMTDPDNLLMIRRLGRELDLSAWFTRPCLIVIGRLENSECPIPFLVDGERVNSEGLTIVRWILPLPVDESIAFSDAMKKDEDAETDAPPPAE